MNGHNLDSRMDWCRTCGRPRLEIEERQIVCCDGDPLKIHPRYWEAKERAASLFNPIVDKVVGHLPLPGESGASDASDSN